MASLTKEHTDRCRLLYRQQQSSKKHWLDIAQKGAHPRLGSTELVDAFNKGGQAFPSLQCPGGSMDEGSCMQGARGHRATAKCPVLAAHCPHHLLCAWPGVAAPCRALVGHLRTGPPALIRSDVCLILHTRQSSHQQLIFDYGDYWRLTCGLKMRMLSHEPFSSAISASTYQGLESHSEPFCEGRALLSRRFAQRPCSAILWRVTQPRPNASIPPKHTSNSIVHAPAEILDERCYTMRPVRLPGKSQG